MLKRLCTAAQYLLLWQQSETYDYDSYANNCVGYCVLCCGVLSFLICDYAVNAERSVLQGAVYYAGIYVVADWHL